MKVFPFCYLYDMKLDYNLTHIINNYMDEDGRAKYDYVGSTIWFSKQELCDVIGKLLNMYIPLETKVRVSREHMEGVWKLLDGREDLNGMYGDEFLNNW